MTIEDRQKEIQQFEINYNQLYKEFTNIENEKYRFKGGITEDYSKKEEYKNMTTGEIQQLQKRKLEGQDERLDEITLDVKKGKQLAVNADMLYKNKINN